MNCQILFSWKNKKNIINLSSAENAQSVVKVKKHLVRNAWTELECKFTTKEIAAAHTHAQSDQDPSCPLTKTH